MIKWAESKLHKAGEVDAGTREKIHLTNHAATLHSGIRIRIKFLYISINLNASMEIMQQHCRCDLQVFPQRPWLFVSIINPV